MLSIFARLYHLQIVQNKYECEFYYNGFSFFLLFMYSFNLDIGHRNWNKSYKSNKKNQCIVILLMLMLSYKMYSRDSEAKEELIILFSLNELIPFW